ncbi:MAG: hypothetical protein K6E51_02845 [Treponema sp.]|nr:hypothetical protein [Treponema sp.]
MEEGLKLSNGVYKYALGGFVKLAGGALKLFEDRIELSRLFGSVTIPLSDLEYVRPTKIIGFFPAGLEFKTKSGTFLRVYMANLFTASSSREKWLAELQKFVLQ